jgi:hypothetical protein
MTAFKPEKCPDLIPQERIVVRSDTPAGELQYYAGQSNILFDVSDVQDLSILPPLITGGVYSTQNGNINLQGLERCHTIALPFAQSVIAPRLGSVLLLYAGAAEEVSLPFLTQGIKIIASVAVRFTADELKFLELLRLKRIEALSLPKLCAIKVLHAKNLRTLAVSNSAEIPNFLPENFPLLNKIELIPPPPPRRPPPPLPAKEPQPRRLVRVPRPKPD